MDILVDDDLSLLTRGGEGWGCEMEVCVGEWSGDSGVARGACPLPAPLPLFMLITGVGLPAPDSLWCRIAGAVAVAAVTLTV